MKATYGRDIPEIFNTLPSFEDAVAALPTRLQQATNFKKALLIEYNHTMELFKILEQIYYLGDLDNCSDSTLDLAGADVGVTRGNYDDTAFREYIRLWDATRRANAGTIPDIRSVLKNTLKVDASTYKVLDNRDGSVTVDLPTTLASDVLTVVGKNLTAAGIDLIITLTSAFELGLVFNRAHERVIDRDDNRAKARRNLKITTGRLCAKYTSRVDIGMEV